MGKRYTHAESRQPTAEEDQRTCFADLISDDALIALLDMARA